jgi:hypothetical protein
LEKAVTRLWKKHHKKIPGYTLKFEELGDSCGTILIENKEICLRSSVMDKTIKKLGEMNVEIVKDRYAEFILAHEMGHAMDATLSETKKMLATLYQQINRLVLDGAEVEMIRLREEIRRNVVEKEKIAWIFGREFLPKDANLALYAAVSDYCLSTYTTQLDNEDEQYNLVVGVVKKIIAINKEIGFKSEVYLDTVECYYSGYDFKVKTVNLYFRTLSKSHPGLTDEEIAVFTYFRELCRSRICNIEELLQQRKINKRELSGAQPENICSALNEIERIDLLIEASLVKIAACDLPSCIDLKKFNDYNDKKFVDLKEENKETREYFLKKKAS